MERKTIQLMFEQAYEKHRQYGFLVMFMYPFMSVRLIEPTHETSVQTDKKSVKLQDLKT